MIGLGVLFSYIITSVLTFDNTFLSSEILNEFSNYQELHRIHREIIPIKFGTLKKCIKEIPVQFLKNRADDELIHGNGSNTFLTRIEDCCEGYKKYEHNSTICVPDCGSKCINGFCIGPGHCECFPSFVKSESGVCVNTCPLGCLNGKCNSNGTCECEDKYNFELNSEKSYCKPICKRGCNKPNQNCSAPDQCTCNDGYKFDLGGNCVPVCKADCYGGICIKPNLCQCHSGFVLKDGICQSLCHKAICTNGFCQTDGTCKCLEGYKYDYETTTCLPICRFDCVNGICIGPGKCKCYNSYGQLENRGPCLPVCDISCCVKPGICDCPPLRTDIAQYHTLRNLIPGKYCVS